MFPLRSLTEWRYSQAHDRRVGRTIRRSARTPAHFSRVLREMRASCFPRLYAAASLKHESFGVEYAAHDCFPRLYAAASLKRVHWITPLQFLAGFPRLYAAASLKLSRLSVAALRYVCFPRLYAAASLKLSHIAHNRICLCMFSAALCRGLIEADRRIRAAAWAGVVFRGFMPRPH